MHSTQLRRAAQDNIKGFGHSAVRSRALAQDSGPNVTPESSEGVMGDRLEGMLCATAWWAGEQNPKCPEPSFAVEEGSGFKPVKILVVFHCE
jgi:hypothetical protein